MKTTLDNSHVSQFWGKQFQRMRSDCSYWVSNSIIERTTYAHMSSGTSEGHWLTWLFDDYFRARPPFDRALSICCGDGAHELALFQTNKVRFIRGFDISEEAVRQAAEKLRSAGADPSRYLFEVHDANSLTIEDDFDLILSSGALHHVANLEGLLANIQRLLRPEGVFVVLEYVGPNRFQWTDQQIALINGILERLDVYYLHNQARVHFGRPTIEEMMRTDPSEAVRSQDIVGLLRRHFTVEYESCYNGTIMHQLYPLLNSCLANHGNGDFDSLIRLILYFEDLLIKSGVLASDFIFMICRHQIAKQKHSSDSYN
jgi:SAM-dependent methyltransferase